MTDWADKKAKKMFPHELSVNTVAAALRQSRIDALEEAANPQFLRPLIAEQSKGEWDDKTINEDVAFFSSAIRSLKDKQP